MNPQQPFTEGFASSPALRLNPAAPAKQFKIPSRIRPHPHPESPPGPHRPAAPPPRDLLRPSRASRRVRRRASRPELTAAGAMAAEKLRDLSRPIDVPLLDATVAAFYGTGSSDEVTAPPPEPVGCCGRHGVTGEFVWGFGGCPAFGGRLMGAGGV